MADAFYRGMADLVLLELDPDRLGAPVVAEEVEGTGEKFPHLYGQLDIAAVIAERVYEARADGTFDPVDPT